MENHPVKLLAKETKWTSSEVRTHPTFAENLISKHDFGPVKLPGLSRNGSKLLCCLILSIHAFGINFCSKIPYILLLGRVSCESLL